jgi:hypothetical protein
LRLFRFREEASVRQALVRDAEGLRLPRGGRVWEAIGWLDLGASETPRIGLHAREIRRRIDEAGVFFWA